MNYSVDNGYFVFSILLFGGVTTAFFLYQFFKDQVKNNSTRLKILNSINAQYIFHRDIYSMTYCAYTETKRQFDRFDYIGYLQAIIKDNKIQYAELISKCEENNSKYSEYISKIQLIPIDSIAKDARKCKLSVKTYMKFEKKLMKAATQNPLRNFSAICKLSYTSPKGRSSYYSTYDYSFDEIKSAYNTVERQIVTREGIAYERAIVTDSLRYDILKRDAFRCQICGASQKDGVTLHVDHIIPISKGGKSVPSNLRTLCNRCNLGKSNKYDPNGLN